MAKKSLETAKQEPTQIGKFQESLLGTSWLGEVVNSEDPLFMGRCKIRVFEKFDELSDELLPWAFPVSSDVFAGGETKGYGSFHYPKKGSFVRVIFNNGDIYSPEYYSVETINGKLQAEIQESYKNCHVVVYDEDEDMHIIYTQEKGLKVYHKGSHLTIDKGKHITLEHDGSPSKLTYIDGHILEEADDDIIEKSKYIYLDGTNKVDVGHQADDQITRCQALIQLLMILAANIDAKIPVTPGLNVNLVSQSITNICSKIGWVAP